MKECKACSSSLARGVMTTRFQQCSFFSEKTCGLRKLSGFYDLSRSTDKRKRQARLHFKNGLPFVWDEDKRRQDKSHALPMPIPGLSAWDTATLQSRVTRLLKWYPLRGWIFLIKASRALPLDPEALADLGWPELQRVLYDSWSFLL